MKIPFLRSTRRDRTIAAVYGAIVAQARAPLLYRAFGIPDTLEARLEMLILHLGLAFDRCARDDGTRDIGQGAFDLFCQDMDDHMREMGVGDLSVPKKMRRVADAFYGRHAAYREAIGDEERLTAALIRNVYDGNENGNARGLAIYVREAVHSLARQDVVQITAGHLAWPDAAAIFRPEASTSP